MPTHSFHFQHGGAFPVFIGSPVQHGNGFGDLLRAFGRFLIPVAQSAARTFIGSTASQLEQGKSLGDAAKASLMPALGSGIEQARKQKGLGHRRRRRTVFKAKSGSRRKKSRKPKGTKRSKKAGAHKRKRSKKSALTQFNF